jgi:hypothetical protein
MFARLTLVLFAAAGTMSSARAADLAMTPPAAEWVAAPSTDCGCGSNMITIYDVEPGVVTRHWRADCECRYGPPARRYRQVAAPFPAPVYESFVEPWRR